MTSLPGGSDPKGLRALDRDRDRTAEILREAAGEGRLGMDELDDRLNAVYAAKTYADLEPVIRDLPHSETAPSSAPVVSTVGSAADRFGGEPTSSGAVAIMGGFTRKGAWVVPATFTAVAIMAGGEIDLRDARFAEPVVNIHAVTIMGGIGIIVPDDAEVHVTGIGVMGAFEHGADRCRAAGSAQDHHQRPGLLGRCRRQAQAPEEQAQEDQENAGVRRRSRTGQPGISSRPGSSRRSDVRESAYLMEIRRKRGDSTPGPREWFTGQVWMDEIAAPVPPSRTRVLSVHFAPGACTAWHRHPFGQILHVTEGEGLVQSRAADRRRSGPRTPCGPERASGTGTEPGPVRS